jgi:hypothetical protein
MRENKRCHYEKSESYVAFALALTLRPSSSLMAPP